MEEVTPERTVRCPWCAEEILATARKCKHCGEFLTKDSSNHGGSEPKSEAEVLVSTTAEIQPGWHLEAEGGRWRCAEHNEPNCEACLEESSPPWHNEPSSLPGLGRIAGKALEKPYTGRTGSREKISKVGNRTEYGLQCTKCGGTEFVAKRSKKAKTVSVLVFVPGLLLAPKTQVKCVTCGTMFKRG